MKDSKRIESWKDRCRDCAYLYEDYEGEWCCDAYELYCEDVKECKEV